MPEQTFSTEELFPSTKERVEEQRKIFSTEELFPSIGKSDEYRLDRTKKGPGFLGTLKRPDGKVSTELSIGVNVDGKEIQIPSLVPTLTKEEINSLLANGPMTDAIVKKAVEHAKQRMASGKSPFLEPSRRTFSTEEVFSEPSPEEPSVGGEIGQIIGRAPLEIEKRPGLGYIAGETLKGTGADLLNTLKRLAQQSKEFLKTTVEQTGAPPMPGQKEFAAYFEKPAPTLKEVGQRGIGLVSFLPKTAINLVKNPYKQITEDPLGTLFLLSTVGGFAFKGLKLKAEMGKFLTKEDLSGALREFSKEIPEFKFDPEAINQDVVNKYDATLKQMLPTSARRPEEITTWPEMPREPKVEPSPWKTAPPVAAPAVPEAGKEFSINVKPEADGSMTITRKTEAPKVPGIPAEAPKIALEGPEKPVEAKITPSPALPVGKEEPSALTAYLEEKRIEGYSEKDLKRSEGVIRSRAEAAGMDPDQFVIRRMTSIEKGTEPVAPPQRKMVKGINVQKGYGGVGPSAEPFQPENLTGLKHWEYEEKMGGTQRRKEPARPVLKGTKRTRREHYEEMAARGIVEDIEKGKLVWEDMTPEEKVAVEHGPYLPEKILELKEKKPTETHIAERNIKRKADDLLAKTGIEPEKIEEFKANAFMDAEEIKKITEEVLAGRKTEGEAVTELSDFIKETVEKEVTPVKEIPPEKTVAFEKEIKDRLISQKELTPEQKEYLKKRGMYEEVEPPAEKPLEEEPPVATAPKERLVKVTVKTPSGDFTQEITEASIEKIKAYAKKIKAEDKLTVGEPYYGKWKEYLPPAQIETLLKDVMRDVKTLKPEVWEKYAGYPFWDEIKEAYKKLKGEQRIKRAVSLTEIQKELQKTPEGKVEWMYLESQRQLKEKRTPTFKKAIQEAKIALVDTSGNIKRKLLKELGEEGKQTVIQHDLIAGTSAKAERVFKKAEGEIYKGLSKEEEGLLNRAIQSRRTIAISKYKPEVKHPMGLTGEEHQAYLKKISDPIQKRADIYFTEMRKALDRLHDEGLLTDEAHKDLAAKGDYSPRRFIQYIDPESTYSVGGKTITVPDSGIKALDEGSYQVMEVDSRSLLNSVISRTEARIARNKANRALYELADKVPDNGIVEKAEVYKETKAGKPVYQKTPAGQTKIKVMIDGQTKEMLMPDEFAKEWITRDPLINQSLANFFGWVSGGKILKPMATGINPGFAITNLPRDLIHVWLTTDEYSSFFPKFGAQIAKDYLTVAKDAFSRKGRWGDYIDEGGGMSFLTYQGRSVGPGVPALGKLQEVLGYVGETSEIWTRLALRERAIKNGKPPTEATWIARNYLDFSQGGNVSKAVDSGVPYLNAAVQGTRGIFRAIGDRPAQTIWKMAQLGALASGLLLANRFINRECWDSIPDREKVNNFIITSPWKTTDKAGNERHFYFKIAKDQAQRVLCIAFENLISKVLGDKVNGDQVASAIQDFIPYAPTQNLPPTLSAVLGYTANKDFWRNEDIWKGPKITAREEYTSYTDPAVREIAKKIGASPDRLNYALGEVFTKGNIYTSLVRGGLNSLFDDLPKAYRETAIEKIFKAVPDIKRVFNMTPPYKPQELKEAKEATVEESTRRYKQRRELEATASQFYKKLYEEKTRDPELIGKAKDFIKSQAPEDRERLAQWFTNYGKIYDIPDRSWWLELVGMPPETKATVFWTKYIQSSEKEKEEMKATARKVPGILSERFSLRFNALLNKWKNENK